MVLGLKPVSGSGLDVVYVRPDANLALYRKVLIKPVVVDFKRNWQRDLTTYSRIFPRAEDVERVRDDMGRVVREQVGREFSRGGYQLVDAPGADVLEVDVQVADLYLNAPDLPSVGITHSYTMSFGEMTLIADLRDSVSGDSLMRVRDRTIGRDMVRFRRTTSVENAAEVGLATSVWARAVRRELGQAKGLATRS